jgi:hypothetical protein
MTQKYQILKITRAAYGKSGVHESEREPRHKLQLSHPGKRSAENVRYLPIGRAIDAGRAGHSKIGMFKGILGLHLQLHRQAFLQVENLAESEICGEETRSGEAVIRYITKMFHLRPP